MQYSSRFSGDLLDDGFPVQGRPGGGFPKVRGPFPVVPTIRNVVWWVPYLLPQLWTPMFGCFLGQFGVFHRTLPVIFLKEPQ